MHAELPEVDVDIPTVDQVGIVVEDLEDGMDRFGAILGVGPWQVYRFEPPRLSETTYRGEPASFAMAIAYADVGGTLLELVQPVAGPSLYTERLETAGEGLHHVASFGFPEPAAAVAAFEGAGMPVIQRGTFEGSTFWYFDTAAALNGVVFKTASDVETLPQPDRMYPA